MAANLLDMIKQSLPSDFSDMAGKLIGESPGATQAGVAAALPAILGGIAQKGATTDGAQSVLSLLNNPAVSSGALGNLPNLLPGGPQTTSLMNSGGGLLTSLMGNKVGALAGSLASVAGLRDSQSATNLLGLLAPIVLGFLKKFVGDSGLGASGLASLLGSQGQFLQGAMDSRLTSALGFASPAAMLGPMGSKAGAAIGSAGAAVGSAGAAVGSAGGAAVESAQRAGSYASGAAAAAARTTGGWMRWLPWVIAAIIVLFIISRLSMCSSESDKAVTTTPTTPAAMTPEPTPPPAAATPTPEAPNTAAAPAPAPDAAAAAAATAAAAASASASAPAAAGEGLPAKVYFGVGQATLSDEAKKAIAGAVEAIKTGDAKVDLTGYTDKTGNAAQNEALAKRRAAAVKEALVAGGVPDANIGMKPPESITGAANDAEARRVEINKAP
jgi:outer membrane protein OmpA-like peptidoglycan-associated protein